MSSNATSHFTVEARTFDVGPFPDPVLAPTGYSPLKLTAKCYTPKEKPTSIGNDALTLLFCHSAGAHKEHWEPIIDWIFAEQSAKKNKFPYIQEAWSLDWMSHGDGAVVNAEVLQSRKWTDLVVPTSEWGAAIAHFIKTQKLHERRIVGIGHSAGSSALSHSTVYFPLEKPPFVSLVLVETTLLPIMAYLKHREEREGVLRLSTAAIMGRRDSWENREQAYRWLIKRYPWSTWDKRIVKLYTEYGMHHLPDGRLQIKCDKTHEATSFADIEAHMNAVAQLKRIVGLVPTFFIYGDRPDLVPLHIRDAVLEAVGYTKESPNVRYVPNAGHLIVQENPNGVSSCLAVILRGLYATPSKL